MEISELQYTHHPLLVDREDSFKALVIGFIEELATLSPEQKQKLGLFKAIELTNATVQNLEKDRAPEALGKIKAEALFNLVRSAIRNRKLELPDGTTVSLKDTKLKRLIDRACMMFHAGKKDPEQKAKAIAFSVAQNIILNQEIQQGLSIFCDYYPELYTSETIVLVRQKYINPNTSIDQALQS